MHRLHCTVYKRERDFSANHDQNNNIYCANFRRLKRQEHTAHIILWLVLVLVFHYVTRFDPFARVCMYRDIFLLSIAEQFIVALMCPGLPYQRDER